ncbi:MAG: M81 family metallopeptidase, partial [Oscillospiraceae bacterium]|nr:M81 family metallopeptidase [Oscillospiraceae bacterium]
DEYDRARDMLRHLYNMITTGKKPCMRLIRLPWVFTPSKGRTISGPAHEIQQFMVKMEAEDENLLQASFFHGFPYADVPHAGVSVATLARDQETADRAALEIAKFAWARRDQFLAKSVSPAEAFDQALELGVRPIVINESSDNPGGGAPGDGTHLLREMLKRNLPDTAFGFITDPEVARLAAEAGVGATIS